MVPLVGLADTDARIIASAVTAAHSPNTRTAYAHISRHWEHWCTTRGTPALPADPVSLCAYLAERAEAGHAIATLNLSCAAIRHVHRLCEAPDLVATEIVGQVRRSLARHDTAPRCPHRRGWPCRDYGVGSRSGCQVIRCTWFLPRRS